MQNQTQTYAHNYSNLYFQRSIWSCKKSISSHPKFNTLYLALKLLPLTETFNKLKYLWCNCPRTNDLKVAVNVHKGYSLPNCFISPADIITPILPRVSAITWRKTPNKNKAKEKRDRTTICHYYKHYYSYKLNAKVHSMLNNYSLTIKINTKQYALILFLWRNTVNTNRKKLIIIIIL